MYVAIIIAAVFLFEIVMFFVNENNQAEHSFDTVEEKMTNKEWWCGGEDEYL